jgi:membrane-associated two-gene conflict system component 1 (EACC1)
MSNVMWVSVDNAEDDLRSFFQWLQDEPDIRHHAEISLEPTRVGEGDMGGTLDVVKLVIDTNFQILNLGLAYLAWRAARAKSTPLTIERGEVEIILDNGDLDVVTRILRALDQ